MTGDMPGGSEVTGMVNRVEGTGQAAYAAAGWEATPGGVLGRDAFLQLLVTQLRHQDPLNPLEGREMVAELAQFSSLEQLTAVAAGLGDLALGVEALNIGSVRLEALSLLGRTVRLVDGTVGRVDTLNLVSGLPELVLDDGTSFGLDDVVEVLREALAGDAPVEEAPAEDALAEQVLQEAPPQEEALEEVELG